MAAPPGLASIQNVDKVTVDRGYLNALVRRANLHDTTPADPASITISRVEYDNLLRLAGEYQSLRNALMMGGADISTLDILVNSSKTDVRKDSVVTDEKYEPERPTGQAKTTPPGFHNRKSSNGNVRPERSAPWRPLNYGASMHDDTAYDDDADNMTEEDTSAVRNAGSPKTEQPQRTLFISGLSERTTYRDLMSVVKGGKIISCVLRNSSALVTFAAGAADFLAWSKRNDIYLQGKRIEVNWAEHQFRVNGGIHEKISRGITRNILIRNATSKNLTEQRIRDDMEHITNLVIVDVRFRGADAYVYTNSIGYATFARTCMLSRVEYKGCKIWYFEDECDVALPQHRATSYVPTTVAPKKKAQKAVVPNRFDLLNTEGTEVGSDEENQDPNEETSEYDDTGYAHSHFGVRLDFLESEG